MSVLIAIGVLVLVLVLIDLALTIGIIRKLRTSAAASRQDSAPRVGLRVDLTKDAKPWPAEVLGMMSGISLAVFVLPGCPGCDQLRDELQTAGGLDVPMYLIGDPLAEGNDEYFGTWPAADVRVLAPVPVHDLNSFEHPDTFPSIALLQDGVVVASGHKLADVSGRVHDLLSLAAEQRVAR
ncbi:MAG: hypothetical protein ABJA34_13705 [Pseudonocardiales bacterium]